MAAFTEEELERLTPGQRRFYEQRADFVKAALEACLLDDQRFKRNYTEGFGIWYDEFGPLTPPERTQVVYHARRILDLPCFHRTMVVDRRAKTCGDCGEVLARS